MLQRPPRFKAGADLSKKVNQIEVKAKRRPRFKAGSDLSSRVNFGINVSNEANEDEEQIAFVITLSEELEVSESEA